MDNLQLNSDFTDEQHRGVSVTFGPPPIPGSIAITTLNGVTGPTISFVGGSSGFTFSPAGATIILGSPLTTKGDLYVRNATVGTRLGVGANGDVLTADSGEATGLKWAPPAAAPDLNVIETAVGITIDDTNDVVLVDATLGNASIMLHDPTTAKQKPYYFKLLIAAGNKMILDGDGFNIDGAATQETNVQYVSFTLIPDNASAEWWIV